MTRQDLTVLGIAAVLVVLAGLVAAIEAALSSFSRSRAQELVREGRPGAVRLQRLLADAPRYLTSALLVRLACETSAVALVTVVALGNLSPAWLAVVVAAAVMLVVSFVVVGVAPRTVGRQHADRVALMSGPLLAALTAVLGPLSRLLILLGNAVTPGRGFREGPFASEAELRDLVDLAEASQVIQSGERKMIHSVFELGDTIVREVMVPRTDVVFIEQHKTLRQCVSLALRSGYSRIPVVGESLDDVVGIVYLKDVMRRIYDNHEAETTERVESVVRPAMFVPDSKPVDALLREMQARRTHVAVVVDEYGGTAGVVTIEDIIEEIVGEITDEYDVERPPVQRLAGGAVRVSSRLPVDELGELFGLQLSDEDVDSIGGLLAKRLGRVPIPGASVEVAGLRLTAESAAGRRNRIGTIVVTPVAAEAVAAEGGGRDEGEGPRRREESP